MQSRYYDPVTHRFINTDSYASTGQGIIGHNMFTYCLNNPVLCVDSSGTFASFCQVYVLQDHHSGGFTLGSAEPYWGNEISTENLTNINCLGYALHLDSAILINGYEAENFSNSDGDLETVFGLLTDTLNRYGYNIKPLDAYDSPIAKNEYRIAMRLGADDYHFMVQHGFQVWSHKPGDGHPQIICVADPATIRWDGAGCIYDEKGTVVATIYNYNVGYYDSKTIFFAVSAT